MSQEFEQMLIGTHIEERHRLMQSHPEYVDEAVELTVANRQPYSWRAAWLLSKYMEDNDVRVIPYINRIIQNLDSPVDGYQRELLKILLKMDLNEDQEGYVYDHCETIWKDVRKQPAVRYYAIKLLIRIAEDHPELMQEAKLLLQNPYMDSLSAGVRKSLIKFQKMKGLQ